MIDDCAAFDMITPVRLDCTHIVPSGSRSNRRWQPLEEVKAQASGAFYRASDSYNIVVTETHRHL